LKLVHPGIHVSTKEAYQGITFSGADNYEEVLSSDPTNWNGQLHNSFEEHIFKLYPAIREIKEQLYEEGADYALMSGSGSSVYGLFKKEPQETFPNYFERIVQF
jgi:4-diphosphocytidyl-2-C-methyl-D-erythritol kinase